MQPLSIKIVATEEILEPKLKETNLTQIKYTCPNCNIGELKLYYRHKGDCRNDMFFYDCCFSFMIFCPLWCGLPDYRICSICETEYYWKYY